MRKYCRFCLFSCRHQYIATTSNIFLMIFVAALLVSGQKLLVEKLDRTMLKTNSSRHHFSLLKQLQAASYFSKTKCSVGGRALWPGVFCSAASRSAVAAGLNSRLIHHADVLTVYSLWHQETATVRESN